MTLSEEERESLCVKAWRKAAKGKPMRWRILRDVVACLSIAWMNTSQIQIAMRRLWALKNKTTRDILEELEMEKAIVQEKSPQDVFRWGATKEGLAFWVKKKNFIPASVVQVASDSAYVKTLEM